MNISEAYSWMRDALAVLGVLCIVVAAFMVSMVIGFVVLGACLIALAVTIAMAVTTNGAS